MCVIAVKPWNIKISKKTVKHMFETNSDGAGLAIVEPDNTTVLKGYIDVETLWADVDELQDKFLVLHFRLKTHGKINAEMCHPFIVDPDLTIATTTGVTTKQRVLFHNGVLSQYGSGDVSDTADFVVSCLAHLPTLEAQLKLLSEIGGKFALVDKGEVYISGTFPKHKGMECSNLFFDRGGYVSQYTTRSRWNNKTGKWDEVDDGISLPTREVSGNTYSAAQTPLILPGETSRYRDDIETSEDWDDHFDRLYGKRCGAE